jgi:hypothetical protein
MACNGNYNAETILKENFQTSTTSYSSFLGRRPLATVGRLTNNADTL